MVLRSKPLLVAVASLFVLFQGDFALAEKKHPPPGAHHAGGEKKPQPPQSPQPSQAAAKPVPIKAPGPTKAVSGEQEIPVCVRPDGVPTDVKKFGFDDSGKVITQNVPQVGKEAWTRYTFVYDPAAGPQNVDFFPKPHNKLICPAIAAPTPAAIAQLLAPSTSGSKELPDLVKGFRNDVGRFSPPASDAGNQAKIFATNLYQAIVKNEAMAPVTINDLSVEAATILANYFRESMPAVMAYKQVIAPYNVQQKFRAVMGEPDWRIFQLVDEKWAGKSDTVPAVFLKNPIHESATSAMKQHLTNATSPADAKTAYQRAYGGLPGWLKSIEPYFP